MDLPSFVTSLGSWPSGKGALNRKLAQAIQRAIAAGVVAPGVRLPAERAFAKALAVSRATVVNAYAALVDAGWVESRRGSGTYVRRGSRVMHAAREGVAATSPLFGLISHDRDLVIDLALGTPYSSGLRRELFTLGYEEESALLEDRMYYPLGLSVLRQALAKRFTSIGLATSEEQVLVTNGAQQAISLIAALYLQRGDAVLVEDPTYFGAIEAFRAAGARVSSVPVGADGVAPGVLRDRIAATAPRLIYLTPTYQNPTGTVMPAASRKAISKLSAEFGVPVIDDAALADIVLSDSPPGPIAAYGEHEGLLTIGSISKLIWPGLRVGWVRAAAPVVERLGRIKTAFDLGSPLATQAIGAKLIQALPEAQRLRGEQLRPRRALMAQLLKRHLPEWRFRVPDGGFFFWARLPAGDARELAQVALRHGILILPGSMMSAAGLYTRFVRVPFLADPEVLRDGVSRLAGAWREYQTGAAVGRHVSAIA